MNFLKIIGFSLLIVGLVIIIGTLICSYNVFTGKAELPKLFTVQEKKEATTTQASIEHEIEKMITGQLEEVLPSDFMPKTFNLIAWSTLAFIFIFGGSQISGLGIKLIKK